MATGATAGAAVGLAGGPFDPVTVPWGSLAGATLGGIGGYGYGLINCRSSAGAAGGGGGGSSGGGRRLSSAARRKLGNLADRAGETIRDVIRDRGGNAANIKQAGPWADKTLGKAAESQ